MSVNKVLVTGGCGFVGSSLVKRLVELDKDVIIIDNLSSGTKNSIGDLSDRIKFLKIDLTKLPECPERKYLEDVDIIFHNAAFVSIRKSFDERREELLSNCLGTLNILEEAVKHGANKFIFASSMAVYGNPNEDTVSENHPLNPTSVYGLSKVRGEMYCKYFSEHYGLNAIILRLFNIYGSGQIPNPRVGVITTFIDNALKNKPLQIYGDGEQIRDFVHVEDVVDANISSMDYKSKFDIFNIGSGTGHSINDIVQTISEHIDVSIQHKPAVKEDARRMVADISKANKKLKFTPHTNLKHGIEELIRRMRK